MIRRLKYSEIDFEKYSNCIENSEQKNFYAQKEILDELSGNWEILVKGDYETVLPYHLKKKFGFNFILMPLFCQQLGVFSDRDDPEVNQEFAKFLNRKFRVFFYAFNHRNRFSGTHFRKNYFLKKQPYNEVRKKYLKGRKSTLKNAGELDFRKIPYDDISKNFMLSHQKGLSKNTDIQKFIDYLTFLDNKNRLVLYGASKNEVLYSVAATVQTGDVIYLLGLFSDENFKSANASSFLIDSILKENIEHSYFSFMGGNIRGIEVFFKSFGASVHQYFCIQNRLKDLIISFFVKN